MMGSIKSLAALTALTFVGLGSLRLGASESEGVALAIIYDTSGSMSEPVRDQAGHATPKYVIANRALVSAARQIQAFTTNSSSGAVRTVDAGLFIFRGEGAREVIEFGRFDAKAFEDFAKTFSRPAGNTPLGTALSAASHAVLASPLPRKHVLIITDGINTAGPGPAAVLPGLQREAKQKQVMLSVHFVAFDVDAKVFDGVKKLGATVVSAADEKQLNSQLEFILQKKILLEDEEPKKP